jgi:hypothetical protein
MKRITALMLGTALAAALSFAQADKPKSTTEKPSTTAPANAKKHKKHAKKSTAPATPAASATPAAPASK